eukprot:scaffold6007_cov183-Amphora_coffeaeformis.AAC.26
MAETLNFDHIRTPDPFLRMNLYHTGFYGAEFYPNINPTGTPPHSPRKTKQVRGVEKAISQNAR